MAAAQTEIVDVPEKLKGLIIGKRRSGLIDISNKTGAKLFLSNHQICATGNSEQIQEAKAMIEKKCMEGTNQKIITISWVPKIKGELKHIEISSRTKIRWENVDNQCKVTITGAEKNCNKANAFIKEFLSSQGFYSSSKQFGRIRKFSGFIGEYADAKFLLEEYKTPPKLSGFIKGTPYRIKICSENNYEVHVDDLALSKINKELLPALQLLHKQKDEKALLVDLWCHFGAVIVHNVKEEDVKDETEFTLENINRRFGGGEDPQENLNFCDLWKTGFDEGISREDVSKDADELMKHEHKQWRYDYAFTSKSGRRIRFKSWQREQLGSDEPPQEVKNLLTRVYVKGQENALLSWLCHPSDAIVRGDLFVPSSKYDIRLKLTSGPRYVREKSPEEDEEDKALSEYLSHCTLDVDNHKLNLPTAEIPLPEGFTCHFYRASEKDFYSVEEGGQTFTIIFLDEKGWDSDTKERRPQEKFGVRVVMDSWKDLFYGHWEPQEIINMLPKYMEFFVDFQNILFR